MPHWARGENLNGDILIARHGPGRGPKVRLSFLRPAKYDRLLAGALAAQPGIRLRNWYTGTALPRLDGVAAIVFLLQDPLREFHPPCYAEACVLADRARERGIRLVNPPDALSNSIKSRQSEIWRNAGFRTPRYQRFQDAREVRALLPGLTFPAIVRSDEHHTQQNMHVVYSAAELLNRVKQGVRLPGSVAPLIDTRGGDEPYFSLYHKKRVQVFGRHVCPMHLFLGPDPIVSSKTSSFGHYRSVNPLARWDGNRRAAGHVRLDNAFVFDTPPEHEALFVRAAETLGLEWCAIDYSTAPDGEPVLWEANPYFAIDLWPFAILPGPRRVAERHERAAKAVAEFFGDLAAVREAALCR
ncbi:MAG: hypothetical protein U0Q16_36470 [Bryobacteraceae bacterium]